MFVMLSNGTQFISVLWFKFKLSRQIITDILADIICIVTRINDHEDEQVLFIA